jgi:hypothetical protein
MVKKTCARARKINRFVVDHPFYFALRSSSSESLFFSARVDYFVGTILTYDEVPMPKNSNIFLHEVVSVSPK